jgi:hypothetical protein
MGADSGGGDESSIEDIDGDAQDEEAEASGAEAGVRAVVLPQNVVKDLTSAFAASETRRTESACWLLCKTGGDQREPELLHCVITDHMTKDGIVVDTVDSHGQLASFLASNPELSVFGWCMIYPSNRRPAVTAAELLRVWSMQERSPGRSMIFAMAWRAGKEPVAGMKSCQLRPDRYDELRERRGQIQAVECASEFFQDVEPREAQGGRRLKFSWQGRWVGADKSVRPNRSADRPMIASAVGQVALDILHLLREAHNGGGQCMEHVVKDLVGDYTPPGGFIGVNRLYEQVKDALLQLRREGFASVRRAERGAPVADWSVQLKHR